MSVESPAVESPAVVIVGGGPNGLLTAIELALGGVRPLVLERLPERETWPKANGLVGRVVQVLHYRGLQEAFSGGAPPWTPPGFQFGGLPLDLTKVPGHALYVLPVPQRRMEEVLEERAVALGVEIRRGHDVTDVRHEPDAVRLRVEGPDGGYELAARYVVGADGGHSVVRKLSGIGFPGITDDSFVTRTGQVVIAPPVALPGTGELDVPGLGRLRQATFNRTETGVFAYGMFQPGLYRVSVLEFGQSGLVDSTDMPLEELAGAMRRVLGADIPIAAPDGAPAALARSAAGRNSRQADRYRHGRVFLVGDAAHVHAGVGGPGLNLGMQDAVNLGWKLAAAVRGWAPDGLLDTYEAERAPAGERVIAHTRAQTTLLSPGPGVTALREVVSELLGDPAAIRRIADLMSGADVRYDMHADAAHPLVGGWLPDLALTVDGRPATVAELMRPARPLLLDLAGRAEVADLVEVAGPWAGRVAVVTARPVGEPPADAVLVRPDGYVAWAGPAGSAEGAAGLRAALATWFGAPAAAGDVEERDVEAVR